MAEPQPTEASVFLYDKNVPGSTVDDDFRPWLEPYLLETDVPRGAVLVCPGGAYTHRARHEAAPVARRFNTAGFHAFIVEYRVSPHRYPAALMDISRAIRIVRSRADAWRVLPDKLAVGGFSAGGHLAGCAGTLYDNGDADAGDDLDRFSNRPDALILCYAALTFGEHYHGSSPQRLLGEDASEEEILSISPRHHVTGNTPPAFLWHTVEDKSVSVMQSLLFAQALQEHGVPFEMHIFPEGRHGLGLADEGERHVPGVDAWPDLCCTWLTRMGWKGNPT